MSGNAGSSNITGRLLALLVPPLSPEFEPLHTIIRKTVHVVAYGLLGALDFRAVRGPRGGWRLGWSAIAVVLAVVIASLDEYHQSFFPSRTGVPGDVVIDACGATLAQLIVRGRALTRDPRFSDSPETSSRTS